MLFTKTLRVTPNNAQVRLRKKDDLKSEVEQMAYINTIFKKLIHKSINY